MQPANGNGSHPPNGNGRPKTPIDFGAVAQAADLRGLVTLDRGDPDSYGKWLCPFHDDHHPSLDLMPGDRRYICRACMAQGDAIDWLEKQRNISKVEAAYRLDPSLRPDENGRAPARELEAAYVYLDAESRPVVKAERWSVGDGRGKDFRQLRAVLSEEGELIRWEPGTKGIAVPPYQLPELLAAEPGSLVFLVEGEGKVNAIRKFGFHATCNIGGAGKWKDELSVHLAGMQVIILPDNDDPGRKHGQKVAASVAPHAGIVKVVTLPGLVTKGDVVDWLASGGTVDEVLVLAEDVAPWNPSGKPETNGQHVGNEDTDDPPNYPYRELADVDMGMVDASTVEPDAVEWLWPNRIAKGKLTLLAGEGGDGKSQLSISLAAAVTTGGTLPDGQQIARIGNVIIVSSEDGARDTIIPRLRVAGANLSRVTLLNPQVMTQKDDGTTVVLPRTFQDLEYWQGIFPRRSRLDLIVIDPITAYLGEGVNDHKNADVRRVLAPFLAIVEHHGVACLAISHVGKAVDTRSPIAKILGSVGYTNLARNVHMTTRDKEDKDRRLLYMVKNSIGAEKRSALAFRIEACSFEHNGKEIKTSRLAFEAGEVDIEASDAMSPDVPSAKRGPTPARTLKVAEWLYDFLKAEGYPTPLAKVFEFAGGAGLIGTHKPDGKWSSVSILYEAQKRIPELTGERQGSEIIVDKIELGSSGRKITHWRLDCPSLTDSPF